MNPTHKPKPPDKGAPPEHKPSRKVALAEVMRSLQDLVSNELAAETTTPKKRRRADQKPSTAHADDAPAVVNSAEEIESITLESPPESSAETPATPRPPGMAEVPETQEQFSGEPLAPAKPSVPGGKTAPAFVPVGTASRSALPPSMAGAGGPSTAPFDKAQGRLRTGLQQELPYLDSLAPAPPESPPELAAPSHIPEPVVNEASFTTTLTLSEENWDDIPVLEEAVDLTDEIDADAAVPGASPAIVLPPAGAARRLAIQVAARLNVELRKSGQTGLNSAIITQLAKILEEALAKNAATMENATGGNADDAGEIFRSPSEKH